MEMLCPTRHPRSTAIELVSGGLWLVQNRGVAGHFRAGLIAVSNAGVSARILHFAVDFCWWATRILRLQCYFI